VLLANVGGAFTVLSLLSLWFAVAAQHATRALRRAAETDPETGLLNRASLREHYDSARADGAAGGRPCALLCLEVDGPRDEAAIAAIAHELRGAVPAGAALGRGGGATFAVFLPGHDMPEAVGLAEDLRRRLDRPAAPGVPPRTVSVGVSLDTSLDDGFAALVGRAEDRLFMAKMAGRNRIIADDRLVAEEGAPASSRAQPWAAAGGSAVGRLMAPTNWRSRWRRRRARARRAAWRTGVERKESVMARRPALAMVPGGKAARLRLFRDCENGSFA